MHITQIRDNKKQKIDKNRSNVRIFLTLLVIGISYYIWIINTGICIPCMFRLVTGYKCPGCGITTMILSLSKFDLKDAFFANPFLFITGPLIIIELIYSMVKMNQNESLPKGNTIALYVYIAFLITFGVVRNIINI